MAQKQYQLTRKYDSFNKKWIVQWTDNEGKNHITTVNEDKVNSYINDLITSETVATQVVSNNNLPIDNQKVTNVMTNSAEEPLVVKSQELISPEEFAKLTTEEQAEVAKTIPSERAQEYIDAALKERKNNPYGSIQQGIQESIKAAGYKAPEDSSGAIEADEQIAGMKKEYERQQEIEVGREKLKAAGYKAPEDSSGAIEADEQIAGMKKDYERQQTIEAGRENLKAAGYKAPEDSSGAMEADEQIAGMKKDYEERTRKGTIRKTEVPYSLVKDDTFDTEMTLRDGTTVYVKKNQYIEAQVADMGINYKIQGGNSFQEDPDDQKIHDYVYVITGPNGQPIRDTNGKYIYTDFDGYQASKELLQEAKLSTRQEEINKQLGDIIVPEDIFGKSGFAILDLATIEGLALTGEIIISKNYDLNNGAFVYKIPGVGWTNIYGYNAYNDKNSYNPKYTGGVISEKDVGSVSIDQEALKQAYTQWYNSLKTGDLEGFIKFLESLGYTIWEKASSEDLADAEVQDVDLSKLNMNRNTVENHYKEILKTTVGITGYYENDMKVLNYIITELEILDNQIDSEQDTEIGGGDE